MLLQHVWYYALSPRRAVSRDPQKHQKSCMTKRSWPEASWWSVSIYNNHGMLTLWTVMAVLHTLWFLSLEHSPDTSLGLRMWLPWGLHGEERPSALKPEQTWGPRLVWRRTPRFIGLQVHSSFCGLHMLFLIFHLESKVCKLKQPRDRSAESHKGHSHYRLSSLMHVWQDTKLLK